MFGWSCVVWLVLAAPCLGASYTPGSRGYIKRTAFYWNKQARLQGFNVCPRETVAAKALTFDRAWTGGFYCGQKTTIKYRCCQGYGEVSGEGCTAVLPVRSPAATAASHHAHSFVSLLDAAGLSSHLSGGKAVTVLAPVDQAVNRMSHSVAAQLNYSAAVATRLTDGPALLKYHVIPGRHSLQHFSNDQLLPTLYSEHRIRVNVFPNGLVTMNCLPVVEGDIQTTAGPLHTLEAALDPTFIYPVTDTLLRDQRLRRFANLLVQARMESLLRSEGPFTVFAPSDDAFQLLPHRQAHAILYDAAAVEAVVSQHVTLGLQCRAVLNNATLRPRQGHMLVTRCSNSATYVSGAAIISSDKMSSNGVVHVIDKILLPRRAMTLMELLADLGLTVLTSMVKASGVDFKLLSTDHQFTLFAPSDSALQGLQRLSNSEAHGFILGHLVSGRHLLRDMTDKHALQTLGSPSRAPLHVRFFRTRVMADDAVVVRSDVEGLNGVVHILDRPLPSPTLTAEQFLRSQGNFSFFLAALRTASLLGELTSRQGLVTVFAVPDRYWEWGSYYYYNYNYNYNDVLRHHILRETFFSDSLPQGTSGEVTNLAGHALLVRRGRGPAQFFVGSAHVVQADVVCFNGVVHVVDRVIQHPSSSS